MHFGNEFWLILFREYISPKLFAVQIRLTRCLAWFTGPKLIANQGFSHYGNSQLKEHKFFSYYPFKINSLQNLLVCVQRRSGRCLSGSTTTQPSPESWWGLDSACSGSSLTKRSPASPLPSFRSVAYHNCLIYFHPGQKSAFTGDMSTDQQETDQRAIHFSHT